jgi:hypothetical protein
VVRINATAMGPYAYKDDSWISYDDMEIIKVKVKHFGVNYVLRVLSSSRSSQ